MMLGMKLLRAATESEYPQSWACLPRHADSLCCWAPVTTTSSRHTVMVTRVTPNFAETCCLDARIIKPNPPYLYGRRFLRPRVKSQPTNQWEQRNPIPTPILARPGAVMWSSISSLLAETLANCGDDDECSDLIRSILFEDVDNVEVWKEERPTFSLMLFFIRLVSVEMWQRLSGVFGRVRLLGTRGSPCVLCLSTENKVPTLVRAVASVGNGVWF